MTCLWCNLGYRHCYLYYIYRNVRYALCAISFISLQRLPLTHIICASGRLPFHPLFRALGTHSYIGIIGAMLRVKSLLKTSTFTHETVPEIERQISSLPRDFAKVLHSINSAMSSIYFCAPDDECLDATWCTKGSNHSVNARMYSYAFRSLGESVRMRI